MKGDLQKVLQKYEIDETDMLGLRNFISRFNHYIGSLEKSIFYSDRCLQNLLSQEKVPGDLKKIELLKGSINSMEEKKLEWQDDLDLLTKVYKQYAKKYKDRLNIVINQISMF